MGQESPGFVSFYTLVNELVRNSEQDELGVLKLQAEQARATAESCGCFQCRAGVEGAINRVRKEIARLVAGGVNIESEPDLSNTSIVPYKP